MILKLKKVQKKRELVEEKLRLNTLMIKVEDILRLVKERLVL